MHHRLTKKAAQDVRSIYRSGMTQFGRSQADRYHRALQATLVLLADHPHLARLRTEIIPPVRIHPFGSHLIVYSDEGSKGILVIRIRHQREDWAS